MKVFHSGNFPIYGRSQFIMYKMLIGSKVKHVFGAMLMKPLLAVSQVNMLSFIFLFSVKNPIVKFSRFRAGYSLVGWT